MAEKPIDPRIDEALKKCNPQKAIYALAEYMGGYDADIIGAVDTANKASQDASAALSTVNTVKATADNALSTANQASATASNAASTASAAQTAAANAQTTADSALAGANAAVNGLDVTSDQSTVRVTATKNTGSPDVNSLPVASAASAGVMNSATFLAVEGLNSRVAALENEIRTYLVVLPNTTPTQTEITTAYRSAYPNAPNPPLDGTVVIDSEKDLFYQWVGGSSQWIKLSGQQIGMFTNSTLGTIKGSTTEGQIAAEADGTGSLVGYDQIKDDITANATGIQTLTANLGTTNTNVTNLDGRVTAVEGRVNNSLIALSSKSDATGVTISGTKQAGQPSETQIPVASATQSGIVTPTMFNAWNNAAKPVINQLDISGLNTKTTIYTYNGGTIDLTINTSGDISIATTGGITLTGQATYTLYSGLQMQAWLKTNNLSLDNINRKYNMDFILYQNNEFKAILKIYLIGRGGSQTTAVIVSYEY